MANLKDMKNKILVIKADAQRTIQTGKITPATYLVINTDEPYADEIIEIMKRYVHWG